MRLHSERLVSLSLTQREATPIACSHHGTALLPFEPMNSNLHRLVYVSNSSLPSGEANAVHVAQMCDAFADLGMPVELRGRPGTGASVEAHYGLRNRFPISLPSWIGSTLWKVGRSLNRRTERVSGVLYYGRNLHDIAQLAAWGYPVGFELHHPPRSAKKLAKLQRIVEAPSLRGLVVTTESLRVDLLARFPALDATRILVAHDGVRANRIVVPRLRETGSVQAVYCGSFHQGKGVETLIAAAAMVPEVTFDVIGGAPEQVQAMSALAPSNVRFLGRLPYDETQRLLPEYDIALAPYGSVVRGVRTPEHESLAAWMSPLKLFEYMGAGLPIVTSELPVLREILSHGTTAMMVSPDDPAAHAAAIRGLARDGALRLRLAKAAQQSLRAYTWENRAARILDFLGLTRVSPRHAI